MKARSNCHSLFPISSFIPARSLMVDASFRIAALFSLAIACALPHGAAAQNAYVQSNLVSDIPGLAANTDTNLLNPWGIAFSATSPFWISDNHGGVSTLYNSAGTPQTLVVPIPSPAGLNPLGAPTGIIFNGTTNFVVASNAVARFIFSTEDGTIVGWSAASGALVKADRSAAGAIYKGLAIGSSGGSNYLYATDFHNGKVDIFDDNYNPVALSGSFTDPAIPAGYAPFGIQNVGGQLLVTYALQDAAAEDDVAGPGHGYVDVFDMNGNLVRPFYVQGVLNSPWGIVQAPMGFGPFGGALLIGNFGDGHINAFDPATGSWMGTLNDATGNNPLEIQGLWGLVFGNGGNGGDPHKLYFTAGIPGPGAIEDHGLFGSLSAVFPAVTLGASYLQHNLVSDIAGLADHTDINLRNPWGISFSASSAFWVSDNHSGLSTLYNSSGTPQSLVVNIPPPANGAPPAAPTGTIFNSTTNFPVAGTTPARFIFATEDGTISGWASGTDAVLKVDKSASGAVYKGLASGSSGGNNYLYAADFHGGNIDVYDANYNPVTLAGTFADATIPAGFAPFNIQNIKGELFVTYAAQDGDKHDDVPGPGYGYVNVFDTAGHLLRRFASTGVLDSPWGVALTPSGFGAFPNAMLIGNFGDGRINAFDAATGTWLGTVNNTNGLPVTIQGLWALAFGNGGNGGDTHTLYFTAGLNGEVDGLFGSLAPISPVLTAITNDGLTAGVTWAGGSGPFLLQEKAGLLDSNWLNVLTTQNRNTPIAKDSDTGFLRVQAQATNTVLPFTVLLNGASEIPAVDTPATGIGTLAIEGTNLAYHITFSGLSGPAGAAHIHLPAAPTNTASPTIFFTVPSATAGTISGTAALTTDALSAIVNGMAYVNIHTPSHGGGEIRGQIVPLHSPITLNGASEVPPISPAGSGTGSLTFIGSELHYDISYSGLAGPATAAHIHGPADTTAPGGVLVPLNTPAGTSGRISGTVSLDPTEMAYVLAGLTYVNIHTTINGGGEIRGQIFPLQFGATMNGAAEVSPTASPGSASATMTLVNNLLSYTINFTNLLSPATAAHIHGPADTAHNGPVLIPFSAPAATAGTISGTHTMTSQELLYLVSGLTYANIHTTNYPGGEIRGQILPRN
jgi:uncharacterized protein (TIGR03118 family)